MLVLFLKNSIWTECMFGVPDGAFSKEKRKKRPLTFLHYSGVKGIQEFPLGQEHNPLRSQVQVWKPFKPGVRGPQRGF